MAALTDADQTLVDRLRLRAQDPRRRTTMAEHIDNYSAPIYPPASLAQVEGAEAALGFRLPNLIREIYLQVGNGGFGPGYGIIGVNGGFEAYGATLVENVERCRAAEDSFASVGWDEPDWRWTERFILYGYWGDNVTTVVDCAQEPLPIYSLDATVLKPHSSGTLRQWWLDWLDGRVQQY